MSLAVLPLPHPVSTRLMPGTRVHDHKGKAKTEGRVQKLSSLGLGCAFEPLRPAEHRLAQYCRMTSASIQPYSETTRPAWQGHARTAALATTPRQTVGHRFAADHRGWPRPLHLKVNQISLA